MPNVKCTGTKAPAERCKYHKEGFRCSRRTSKYGPFCWQHTQIKTGVAVKKSSIPNAGQGLFAKKTFKRDEPIARYSYSAPVSKRELDKSCPGKTLAAYAIEREDGKFENSYKSNDGVARYSNDAHGTNKRTNGEFREINNRVWIVAKKRIKPGQEIFTDYGENYWQ